MHKRNLFILYLLIVFLLIGNVYAAANPSANFNITFSKPEHNDFFFSDPMNAQDFYTPRSIAFSSADMKNQKEGYPAYAYVGIAYDIESTGTLSIYCNAKEDHSAASRLATNDAKPTLLDYVVEVYDKHPDNGGVLECSSSKITDMTAPVYSINSANGNSKATIDSAGKKIYKTRVLKFIVKSNNFNESKEYVYYNAGDYTGFVILEFSKT